MTKILLIDNDDDLREAIESVLKSDGFDVHALDSSKNLIENMNGNIYKLALVDYKLDHENGIKLAKIIKSYNVIKDIPVIIISSLEGAKEEVKKAGLKYFLAKPFNIDKLLSQVHSLTV